MLGSKLLRLFWYCLLVFFLCFILLVWGFVNANFLLHAPFAQKIGYVGNLFGFLTLYLFVILTVIGVRLPLLEKAFGLDRLIRLHKNVAPLAIIFASIHAICRIIVYAKLRGEGWDWDFAFQFFPYSWDIGENALILARWALLLLIFCSLTAQAGRFMVPFRIWKPTHAIVYYVVAAGFVHAIVVGRDVRTSPLIVVWGMLFLAWMFCTSFRFKYLSTRAERFTWILEGVDYETHDVHTCRFIRQGDPGTFKTWKPGQFALFRMKSKLWGWSEPHPFTLSCLPEPGKLCCTVKGVGSFSRKMRIARPGTKFMCEGPYGVFTPNFEKEKKLVLIAGGIGITPFLSIIRHVFKHNLSVSIVLIWGNKSKKDIVAYSELSRLVRSSERLKVVHVLSDQKITDKLIKETEKDGFIWEQGLVSGPLIKKHIGGTSDASFYLCGPPPMQRFVLSELKTTLGVSPRKVKRELFILY